MLLQSRGLTTPQQAATLIARLQREGMVAVAQLQDQLEPVADAAALSAALEALQANPV